MVIGAHSPEFPFEHDLERIPATLTGWASRSPLDAGAQAYVFTFG
jgi:hypothetical protein